MFTELRKRFPSRQEVLHVFFGGAILPIHIWAVLAFLQEIPGYLLRFSIGQIVTLGSYVTVFALFESIIITLFFVLIAGILPAILLRGYFVSTSCSVIWLTSIWVIPIHAVSYIYQALPFSISQFQIMIFLWVMSYLVVLLLVLKRIRSVGSFNSLIERFVGKVFVLAAAYLIADVLSLIIIIIRVISISLERS